LTSIILVAVLLSACNLPNNEEEAGNLVLTAAAETVSAQLTQDAANATSTPTPTDTPAPSDTPAPTSTLAPTNTQAPIISGGSSCDSAGWVSETIPDGSSYTPGAAFTKSWTFTNAGTCTWTSGYKLVFNSGEAMGAPASQQLTNSDVAPGQQLTVSVNLTAPNAAGTYRGNFQMQNASGVSFGLQGSGIFWVEIKVGGTPSPSITPGGPTLTPTVPAPSVYASSSSFVVAQTFTMNLDNGTTGGGGSDLWFQVVNDDNKQLVPQNGATAIKWGLGQPSYANCNGAALNSNPIAVNADLVGQYICYKTDSGRVGFLNIKSLTPADKSQSQSLDISFTTYE
jgi:hypothetical protein